MSAVLAYTLAVLQLHTSPCTALLASKTTARDLKSDASRRVAQNGAATFLAICMSGSARTIVDDDVRASFNNYVRTEFGHGQGLRSKIPDLFISIHTGDSVKEVGGRWGHPAETQSKLDVEQAIKSLDATDAKIDESAGKYDFEGLEDKDLEEQGIDPQCLSRLHDRQNGSVARMMNFFDGWRGCHELVTEHEAKHGKQYDRVMFTRPDLLYYKPALPDSWFTSGEAFFCNRLVFYCAPGYIMGNVEHSCRHIPK